MAYSILATRPARKGLAKLDPSVRGRVGRTIDELANEPPPTGSRQLVDRPAWRVRIGDYRVIYEIDDTEQTITIVHVGHRKDVYRDV